MNISDRVYGNAHCVKVGLVICTYSSVPYIHLQLESAKRNDLMMPILVHDNGSTDGEILRRLCRVYRAHFLSGFTRLRSPLGEMRALVNALQWSQENQLDILVKFCSRWVPRIEWVTDLRSLAMESQASTFTNFNRRTGCGFRTECIAINAPSYISAGAIDWAEQFIASGGYATSEECLWDEMSQKVKTCGAFENYMANRPETFDDFGVFEYRKNYVQWPFMGTQPHLSRREVVWQMADPPGAYAALATEWGLAYSEKDFSFIRHALGSIGLPQCRPILQIITAATRPENLPRILRSIASLILQFDLRWIIVYNDGITPVCFTEPWVCEIVYGKRNVGGFIQKNRGIELCEPGWIYFLDDDNLILPDFGPTLLAAIGKAPEAGAFLFDQINKNGSLRLVADATKIYVGNIDQGQAVLHSSMIDDHRYGIDERYDNDGVFLEAVFKANLSRLVISQEPATGYNLL
jgi:hypothetical protein